jgi:uncharacterized protein YfaP (DUF2135 family)
VEPLFQYEGPDGRKWTLGSIAGILLIVLILALTGHLADLPKIIAVIEGWRHAIVGREHKTNTARYPEPDIQLTRQDLANLHN